MAHLWVENGTKVSRGWHVLSRYLLMIMLVVIMIMIRIRIRIIRMIGDNHDEDGDDDVVILSGTYLLTTKGFWSK